MHANSLTNFGLAIAFLALGIVFLFTTWAAVGLVFLILGIIFFVNAGRRARAAQEPVVRN